MKKKKIVLVVLVCLCFILVGCNNKEDNTSKEKYISKNTIEELSKTKKIIIKNESNNTSLGTITDISTINEVLEIIENSSQNGDFFNCDGTNIVFEMYNKEDLIDTIYIWTNNERVMPKSIKNSGCEYYSVPKDKANLKSIIEKNTSLKFYTIYDESEDCDAMQELIYEDSNYKYYFDCVKSDKVFIEFTTTNEKMSLKEAINNNYITAEEVHETYPDLLIKKEK